jgi:hypothetical protein
MGLLMGTFFPVGLGALKDRAAEFTPWAWAINGVCSVIAPVLGIALSVAWGLQLTFILGLLCYLGAGIVASRLGFFAPGGRPTRRAA